MKHCLFAALLLTACGASPTDELHARGQFGVGHMGEQGEPAEVQLRADAGPCVVICYDSTTYDEHWCECDTGGEMMQ
jgi:hypothetical protein